MAVNQIILRLRDIESDTRLAAVPLYVPIGDTLAHYSDFAEAAATAVDAVSESRVETAELVMSLDITGSTRKANPVASSFNERGGIIGMDTSGQWNDSFRIPAILHSIMSGDSFTITGGTVLSLINFLVAGDGIVIPKTRDGFDWVGAGLYGSKSVRRK